MKGTLLNVARAARGRAAPLVSSTIPLVISKQYVPTKIAASIFLGGVAYTQLPQKEEEIPALGKLALGKVSREGEDNLLYVAGSISNANKTGQEFAEMFQKQTGIKPRYINSQMDISEYPGQLISTADAIERNDVVEKGIVDMIATSKKQEFTIIAHSAGSKTALAAVNKFYQSNPDSNKKINIMLAGAGTPGLDLQEHLDRNLSNKNVNIIEFRNELDLVPVVGGADRADHNIVYFNTPKSETAIATIRDALGHEPEQGEWSVKSAKALIALGSLVESHFCIEYVPVIAEYYMEKRKKEHVREMVAHNEVNPVLAFSPSNTKISKHASERDCDL